MKNRVVWPGPQLQIKDSIYRRFSKPVVFSLFAEAEPQRKVPVAGGAPVHISISVGERVAGGLQPPLFGQKSDTVGNFPERIMENSGNF